MNICSLMSQTFCLFDSHRLNPYFPNILLQRLIERFSDSPKLVV